MAKILAFKKWYQKNNWAFTEKFENIHSMEVENSVTELIGHTEKAIICNHTEIFKFKGERTGKIYFPKAALIVMEENDEEHFEEMNKVENKSIALKEVNNYLNSLFN